MSKFLSILGILVALFGLIIAPGIMTRMSRRRIVPYHRLNPDESGAPFDLSDYHPLGVVETGDFVSKKYWAWNRNKANPESNKADSP